MKALHLAFAACALTFGISSAAIASEAECQKIKTQHDLIYAAKGFCFKDKADIEKYGDECKTKKPKFSAKEQAKLDEIKERMKVLNCKD